MGQRTKNRIMEHSGPGHRLDKATITHEGIKVVETSEHAGKQFWRCSCGWEGWLTQNLDDPD